MSEDVLGLIVLFKPDPKQLMVNISSVVTQVEKLLILDNTPDQSNESSYKENIENAQLAYPNKIVYKKNNTNLGLPPNYNFAIEFGRKNNMKFLLLLDQDSNTPENTVTKLLSDYQSLSKSFKVGAVCALNEEKIDVANENYLWDFYRRKGMYNSGGIREIVLAMNSGFMAPISVYTEIGGYDENYFLDCVDQEMCLRMISCGYKIFKSEQAVIGHFEGELIFGNFLGIKFPVIRQTPKRYYYISRGTFQLLIKYWRKFPSISIFLFLSLIGRNMRIIGFPNNRVRSWFYTSLGVIHFFRGIRRALPES